MTLLSRRWSPAAAGAAALAALLLAHGCSKASTRATSSQPPLADPFAAVWVAPGLDKVWRFERRAAGGADVTSPVWDGKTIRVKAAVEESPGVNLIVETEAAVAGVSAAIGPLTGPGGFTIGNGPPRARADVFSSAGTPLQVLAARYVQITGINSSNFGYTCYFEERVVPRPLRLPPAKTTDPGAALCDRSHSVRAAAGAAWADRPGANQWVPNVLVPMEVDGAMDVPARSSQLFALDLWLSASVIGAAPPAGLYRGEVEVRVGGTAVRRLPFELELVAATLPYAPAHGLVVTPGWSDTLDRMYSVAARAAGGGASTVTLPKAAIPAGQALWNGSDVSIMAGTGAGQQRSLSGFDLATGTATVSAPWTTAPDATSWVVISAAYDGYGTAAYDAGLVAQRRLDQLLHAYRVSPSEDGFDAVGGGDATGPTARQKAQLDGTLYAAGQGYAGPGQGTGDYAFFIGPYGGWRNSLGGTPTAANVQGLLDGWAGWLDAHAPACDVAWYVTDEPAASALAQPNAWIGFQHAPGYTGPGRRIPSLVTYPISGQADLPQLGRFMSSPGAAADTAAWVAGRQAVEGRGGTLRLYNGSRAGLGSFMTEDTGVSNALPPLENRHLGTGHHFYWQVNYLVDFQNNSGTGQRKDVWTEAMTFGHTPVTPDPLFGWTVNNGSNGDGVLVYPGRDRYHPASDLGLDGYFPSFRLRAIRLGINLELWAGLAAQADAPATAAALATFLGAANGGVPQLGYQIGVQSIADPTYQYGGVTWSEDPAAFEALRLGMVARSGY